MFEWVMDTFKGSDFQIYSTENIYKKHENETYRAGVADVDFSCECKQNSLWPLKLKGRKRKSFHFKPWTLKQIRFWEDRIRKIYVKYVNMWNIEIENIENKEIEINIERR